MRLVIAAIVAAAAAAILASAAGPAEAHQGHLHWWELDTTWTWDPLVTLPLAAMAALHAIGAWRLGARGARGGGIAGACFWAGWTALAVALVSPLHWLGERLFVAHMVEHQLLMSLAAPLLVLGRPMAPMLWGLPARWRRPTAALVRRTAAGRAWMALTRPGTATLVHGLALWAWHVPVLFEAALASPRLHWLQHLTFLVTALLFWWAMLRRRDRGYGIAVLCLLITAIHSGMLGALLAGAQGVVYPGQAASTSEWGLEPIDDQALAGLVMWVPGGLVYAAAALAFAGVWISRAGRSAGSSASGASG